MSQPFGAHRWSRREGANRIFTALVGLTWIVCGELLLLNDVEGGFVVCLVTEPRWMVGRVNRRRGSLVVAALSGVRKVDRTLARARATA